jgi:hypothetical protein
MTTWTDLHRDIAETDAAGGEKLGELTVLIDLLPNGPVPDGVPTDPASDPDRVDEGCGGAVINFRK